MSRAWIANLFRRREAAPALAGYVPLAKPDIGEEEIDAVVECLRSGWLTGGGRVAQFELDFAAFLGGGHTVAVSSATAGLELALAALRIGPGDEVITTDYTFTATAMSVVHVGATPVLTDIDPATFNIDPAQIESAITPRTKAVIPVHFAGLPCDLDAINTIARKRGLKVIEDASHALPSRQGDRMIGNGTSDATVFSFYPSKAITTGEGGMIAFKDPAIAQRAQSLRLHGIDRDAYGRQQFAAETWRYDVVGPGIKANMTDIAAAIGTVQLRRAWAFHRHRSELWTRYDDALAMLPVILPPRAATADLHGCHLYALRLKAEARIGRDLFIAKMAEKKIQCGVHFIPLHNFSYWREHLHFDDNRYSQAQAAFEREITLPLFHGMTDDQQQMTIDAARRLLS